MLCPLLLFLSVLVLHFGIQYVPVLCLLLGILVRITFPRAHLEIFTFLIPLIPALSSLENIGFPPNYLLLPLLFLGGMIVGEAADKGGGKSGLEWAWPAHYSGYLFLLAISSFFVLLRWSNLTLSPLAFLRDTPIAPTGQRLSFGIIFLVVELGLFFLSPFYLPLLRRAADPRRILIAFLSGQSLSIAYSFFQRLRVGSRAMLSVTGLASDATAFGLLSALSLLLAWYLFFRCGCKKWGLFFAFVSLLGILNSQTRIGFLIVLLVIFLVIFTSKRKALTLALLLLFLTGAAAILSSLPHKAQSGFLNRLQSNFLAVKRFAWGGERSQGMMDDLLSGRNELWKYNWDCVRHYPLTGVGAGNYVFWVMAAHNKTFFHHLPSSQYFFIASSTGVIGLLVFLLFCFGLFRRKEWPERLMLGAFLFLFLVNDYLWFPEVFLVFWLFASLRMPAGEVRQAAGRSWRWLCAGGLLLYAFLHLLDFSSLHPQTWARSTLMSYDYGFSYPETDGGRRFRWIGRRAGVYVQLGAQRPRNEYKLTCKAPVSRLPRKRQEVDVYWRGRLYRRVVFYDQGDYSLVLADARHLQGFLEFRVRPVFNLKTLGLGDESRNLGVQVSGPGI